MLIISVIHVFKEDYIISLVFPSMIRGLLHQMKKGGFVGIVSRLNHRAKVKGEERDRVKSSKVKII